MARGEHTGSPAHTYKEDLQRELQLMEEQGLWRRLHIQHSHRYMEDPHVEAQRADGLQPDQRYIAGTLYLYEKSCVKSLMDGPDGQQ